MKEDRGFAHTEFKFHLEITVDGENYALGCDFSKEYNNKTLTKELIDEGFDALILSFYIQLQDLNLVPKGYSRRVHITKEEKVK